MSEMILNASKTFNDGYEMTVNVKGVKSFCFKLRVLSVILKATSFILGVKIILNNNGENYDNND